VGFLVFDLCLVGYKPGSVGCQEPRALFTAPRSRRCCLYDRHGGVLYGFNDVIVDPVRMAGQDFGA
jgi:hypothetical protein